MKRATLPFVLILALAPSFVKAQEAAAAPENFLQILDLEHGLDAARVVRMESVRKRVGIRLQDFRER